MNPFSRSALGASLLAAALLLAPGARANADDDVGIEIHQTGRVLVFPPALQVEGVPSGEVRVVLSVDANGKLTDLLIVGYTNPEFGDAVEAALQTWTYEPARVHGRAIASRVDLEITFNSEVSVLVINLGWHYWERMSGQWQHYAYKAYKLGDLDRIPTPVHVIQPVLARGDASPSTAHEVTVDFFIDEKGKVRVPTVERQYIGDVYAAAMIAAVEQWTFEPPLRHGKPVLVIAQQTFNFRAKQ